MTKCIAALILQRWYRLLMPLNSTVDQISFEQHSSFVADLVETSNALGGGHSVWLSLDWLQCIEYQLIIIRYDVGTARIATEPQIIALVNFYRTNLCVPNVNFDQTRESFRRDKLAVADVCPPETFIRCWTLIINYECQIIKIKCGEMLLVRSNKRHFSNRLPRDRPLQWLRFSVKG